MMAKGLVFKGENDLKEQTEIENLVMFPASKNFPKSDRIKAKGMGDKADELIEEIDKFLDKLHQEIREGSEASDKYDEAVLRQTPSRDVFPDDAPLKVAYVPFDRTTVTSFSSNEDLQRELRRQIDDLKSISSRKRYLLSEIDLNVR